MNRVSLRTLVAGFLFVCSTFSCDKEQPPVSANLGQPRGNQSSHALSSVDSDGDGYSPKEGDCNDADAFVSPISNELCDEVDNDCDSEIDNAPWVDSDGDGFYSLASCLEWSQDCNDNDPNVWVSCASCLDNDADGAYAGCDTYDTVPEDCDDEDPRANPDLEEVCDGIDNDCDLDVDEALTSPEIVLLSNDTLDCQLDGSPFNTSNPWEEPRVRIAANAHDVTIRNCILSNRIGAIDLGSSEDVTIEHVTFVPRAATCNSGTVGVIAGDYQGTLTVSDVAVIADDGDDPALWRYTAIDVTASSSTSLIIQDSYFAAAAGVRAYTGSAIIVRNTQFRGNETAIAEYKEGNSDALPLAGISALASSIIVEDSVFDGFNDGCILVDVGNAEITGNRFVGCDTALDTTGSSAGYVYLNDIGMRFALGPIQLYDSRPLPSQHKGNYWGGACAGSTFDPGDFFDTYSPPDSYPIGTPIAGVAKAIRTGVLSATPPCPATGDADSDGITVAGGDCDDSNPNVWASCGTCADGDSDGFWYGCDAYITIFGPDCDDSSTHCSANCFPEDLDSDGSPYFPACGRGPDCDDSNPDIYAGAVELPDGLDNDCNGINDDPFVDQDLDGLSPLAGDCDDTDPRVWYSCSTCADLDGDGIFAGCDAYIPTTEVDCDDGDDRVWTTCSTCADVDLDGFYAKCDAYLNNDEDCDDDDDTVSPDATEVCDDVDNNCDGNVDEGLSADNDGDGHFSVSSCLQPADDCDDGDPENWASCSTCSDNDNDGVFTGCDRYYTRIGPDCDDTVLDPEDMGMDLDHDGSYGGCAILALPDRVDCDDSTALRDPLRDELPCDGVDNDCDAVVDENATLDCVPLTSTTSLETPELQGHIERSDENGRPLGVTLLGTNPPAVSLDGASHATALQDFIAEHSIALGVSAPPELGSPTMRTTRNDVFEPVGGPGDGDLPHEVPPVAITTVAQYYSGTRLYGDEVHLTSILDDDDVRRLRFIDGTVYDPDELDTLLGHLNVTPAISYADALEIARSWCEINRSTSPIEDEELTDDDIPAEVVIDRIKARHIYIFLCKPYILMLDPEVCDSAIDPVTECVETTNTTAPGVITLDFNKARATFTALKDVNSWLPNLSPTYPPPPGAQQDHENVPVDAARFGGGCLYRGTYGGNDPFFGGLDSEFPYPRTNDSGGTEIYRRTAALSDCNQPNDAFRKVTSASFINQMAHQQIAVAAEAVATSSVLSLAKKYSPRDTDKLRVDVKYTWSPSACQFDFASIGVGRPAPGSYWPPKEDICLNPRKDTYQPYQTALHEYGHYLADEFGLAIGLQNALSCEDHSVSEGVADAFVLSIVHYLRGAHTLSETDARSRYLLGPGRAMDASPLANFSTSPFTTGPKAMKSSQVECEGPGTSSTYQRGMAIGQVMWSLLNNHYCPGNCNNFSTLPTRVLDVPLLLRRIPRRPSGLPVGLTPVTREYSMSVMAREAFTNTLLTTHGRFAVNSFLKRMRDFMEVNYRSRMTEPDWARIEEVFALHALD